MSGDKPDGWKIDSDGWLYRPIRAGDPLLINLSEVGFRDEPNIYARSADFARKIDNGDFP